MHNLESRCNHQISYTLTLMVVIATICALSTRFHDYSRSSDVTSRRVKLRSIPNFMTDRQVNDLAVMSFDLKVDLNDVFNWNVKQLFVYLTAEYSTDDNSLNSVVIWDRIIERHDDAVVDLHDVASKYYFWDDGRGLRNRNVTLILSWNVIPVAGFILDVASPTTHQLVFPNVYEKMVVQ